MRKEECLENAALVVTIIIRNNDMGCKIVQKHKRGLQTSTFTRWNIKDKNKRKK